MSNETLRGLERGLSVLAALERHDGLSLKELHRQTKLPKPTLLRILSTLEFNGYARRRIADGVWRRSARGQEPPSSRLEALLLDIGGEALDELCRRIIWPSDLAIYRSGKMQILDTSRRLTPFVINHSEIGLRVPVLQSGLGLAWLAYCPDDERQSIVTQLLNSDDPYDRLAREPHNLAAAVADTLNKGYGVRARGYLPRGPATDDNTCGIAVPIFAGGRVVAAVNLVWILSALDETAFVARYLVELRATAGAIGQRVDAEMQAES